MQEIITWVIISAAFVILAINMIRVLKLFKKTDPCKGCGSSCEKCPIYMKGKQ